MSKIGDQFIFVALVVWCASQVIKELGGLGIVMVVTILSIGWFLNYMQHRKFSRLKKPANLPDESK